MVHQALHDADCFIADTALQLAKSGHVGSVIANDTCVLVLLVHHFKPEIADIFFQSQSGSHLSSKHVNVSIRAISNAIGE